MAKKLIPAVLITLLLVGASVLALQRHEEAGITQDGENSDGLPRVPLVERTTQGIQASDDLRIDLQNEAYMNLEFYQNNAYECGLSGVHSFMVMNPINSEAGDEAPLWVYLHGGGSGYWAEDGTYYAVGGQTQDTWNHEETSEDLLETITSRIDFNGGQVEDNTLSRRIMERYRLLVVSMCDHDQYLGMGTAIPNHPSNPNAEVNGLQATMAAIDYTVASYPTTNVFVHGTSAGSVGAYAVGLSYAAEGTGLTGVVSDSILTSRNIVIQNLFAGTPGFPQQEGFETSGVDAKVGVWRDSENLLSPEDRIAAGFEMTPILQIGGTIDSQCAGDRAAITEAVAEGFDNNCRWMAQPLKDILDAQPNNPHGLALIEGEEHVPTINVGASHDIVDSFISASIQRSIAYPFEEGTTLDNDWIADQLSPDNHNVLYIGHSFGNIFAKTLSNHAELAGITNHSQYNEQSGGASGAPDALWADEGHRETIKAYLDTGEVDVLIMICCSIEFIETGLQSDAAIWNFTSYAIEKNPETHIGLAMPWKDFPAEYENGTGYRNQSDVAYDAWVNLSTNLSTDFPSADVFTFNHGAVLYELRDMFEAGELDGDVDQLTGPKETSIFTDAKGHAGQIAIDTGTLVWLHAVYGIEPTSVPEFEQYEVDIRQIAQTVIDEQNQQ